MSLPKQFLDIFLSRPVALEQMINNNDTVTSCLFASHHAPAQHPIMLVQPFHEKVTTAHVASAQVPEVRVYAISDTLIVGSSHLIKNDSIVSSSDLVPQYVHFFQTSGYAPVTEQQRRVVKTVHDPAYCVTHFNVNGYGHFLLECLPRVFVVDYLYKSGYVFPLVIPSDMPEFAKSIIMKVNPAFILLNHDINGSTMIRRLLLPSMCNSDNVFHNFFLDSLLNLSTSRCVNPHRRIFVLRREAGTKSFRRKPVNEDALIMMARIKGFEVVDPGSLTFDMQIRMFSDAKYIIGEYGSGMHNAILTGSDLRVLAINWVNEVQQRIAQSRRQRIGFVLPKDGEPRWVSGDNNIRQDYEIDVWQFNSAIDLLLAS